MAARVLVVDGDEGAIDALEAELRKVELEPLSALDEGTALRLFEEFRPAVVLLGVRAESLDCRGLARAMRARAPNVPLLFMGYGGPSDPIRAPSEALDAGGDYYFRLPTDLGYLAGRVRGWARTGPAAPSEPEPAQHEELYALSAELDGDLDLEGMHGPSDPPPHGSARPALHQTSRALEGSNAYPRRASGTIDTARALVREAEALRKAGRTDDAIEAYLSAASIYSQDGEVRPALALYKLLLYLQPSRLELVHQGALFAARHGLHEDARAMLKRGVQALEQARREGDALDLVARFIEQTGVDPVLVSIKQRLEAIQRSGTQRSASTEATASITPDSGAVRPRPPLPEHRPGPLRFPPENREAGGWPTSSLDASIDVDPEARSSEDLYPNASELARPPGRGLSTEPEDLAPTVIAAPLPDDETNIVSSSQLIFEEAVEAAEAAPTYTLGTAQAQLAALRDAPKPERSGASDSSTMPRRTRRPRATRPGASPEMMPIGPMPPDDGATGAEPRPSTTGRRLGFGTSDLPVVPANDPTEAGPLKPIVVTRGEASSAFLFPPADDVPKTNPGDTSEVPGANKSPGSVGNGPLPTPDGTGGHPPQPWIPPVFDEDDLPFDSKTEEVDVPALTGRPTAFSSARSADGQIASIEMTDEGDAQGAFDTVEIPLLGGQLAPGDIPGTQDLPSAAFMSIDEPAPRSDHLDGSGSVDGSKRPSLPPFTPAGGSGVRSGTPIPAIGYPAIPPPPASPGPSSPSPRGGRHATTDTLDFETPDARSGSRIAPRTPSFTQGQVNDLQDALEVLGELFSVQATGVLRAQHVQLVIANGQPAALRGETACQDLLANAQRGRPVPLEALPESLELVGAPAALAAHLVERGVMSGAESEALLHNQFEMALRSWLASTGAWQFHAVEVFGGELLDPLPDIRRTLIDLLDGVGIPVPLDRDLIIRGTSIDSSLFNRRDARFAALLDGRRTIGEAARIAGLLQPRAAAVAVVLLGFRLAVAVGRAPPTEPRPHEWPGLARLRAMAEMIRTSDYFTMLAVGEQASAAEIDDAHARLRALVPSDANPHDGEAQALLREVVRSLDEARDVLKVPELRAAYLRHRRR